VNLYCKIIFAGFFFIITINIFSQDKKTLNDSLFILSDTLDITKSGNNDLLFENFLVDMTESELLDVIEKIQGYPYNLNTVTAEQLGNIPYISSFLANKILEYRKTNIKFRSKNELMNIEGIDKELYNLLKYYFAVKNSDSDIVINSSGIYVKEKNYKRNRVLNNFEFTFKSRFSQDLQPSIGFLNNNYAGSRPKIYNQLNAYYEKNEISLEGNITIVKDPGEISLADFISGYLALYEYKHINTAIIGDYVLNFGQGLSMHSAYYISKSLLAVNSVRQRDDGPSGYYSGKSIQFFRGAAVQMNYNNLYFDIFISHHYLDANIDTTSDNATSFYYSGFHRTYSELNKKNTVLEKLIGGRVHFDNELIKIGTAFWTSDFSRNFIPDSLIQLFKFSGKTANVFSLDYNIFYKNLNIFGELARSQNNALAGISSVQINFTDIADVIFSYRNYSRDFISIHSFGFGKGVSTQNETGFYSGIKIKPINGLYINAYYDFYKFPYRTYFYPVPFSGREFVIYASWKPEPDLLFEFNLKNDSKDNTQSIILVDDTQPNTTDNKIQTNIGFGFTYTIKEDLKIKSKLEFIDAGKTSRLSSTGWLFFSDFGKKFFRKLILNARIIFFDADDYNSRLYEYEDDIKGFFSNVSLYNSGMRWYVLASYIYDDNVRFWGKYSETRYNYINSIGYGNDLIEENLTNRLNLGVEIKF
jgi:hypothetical protein